MSVNKTRLSFIILLVVINAVLDYWLYLHVWLGYLIAFSIGVLFGLIAGGEAIGDLKALLYAVFFTVFPLVLLVLISEELIPRFRRWLFIKLHKIDTWEARKEVEEFLKERTGSSAVIVRVDVKSNEGGQPYLWLMINDEEEFVKLEDEIKEHLASKYSIKRESIAIYWDDQWRY